MRGLFFRGKALLALALGDSGSLTRENGELVLSPDTFLFKIDAGRRFMSSLSCILQVWSICFLTVEGALKLNEATSTFPMEGKLKRQIHSLDMTKKRKTLE